MTPAEPQGTKAMAVVRWLLVAAMAAGAGASLWSYVNGVSSHAAGSDHTHGQLFYCPMHPQIVRDRPGECPICGMTLVPKPDGPARPPVGKSANSIPGLMPVDIPIDRIQRIGIRTARVGRGSLSNVIRIPGMVQASERGLSQVSARSAGWIETLAVSETGQRIKRGQVLASIYSPDVLQAEQELLTAVGWNEGSQVAASSPHTPLTSPAAFSADARRRLELLGVSPQEIDSIVKSGHAERAVVLRAPADGYVIDRRAVAGMAVSPGAPLFEIADLSTVWVVAEVYESDISRIKTGQAARFETNAFGGEIFSGKVEFISPVADPSAHTLSIRLGFRNRPGPGGLKLRPGMYGNLSLNLPAIPGLFVPSEAVVDTGEAQYVFIAKAGGRFEPRRITRGGRSDDNIEIIAGVVEGEVVVTTANFLVDSESRLRAAIEGR